jgi:hypothetical protein
VTEREVRLECLRLAAMTPGLTGEALFRIAESMYEWVEGPVGNYASDRGIVMDSAKPADAGHIGPATGRGFHFGPKSHSD